MGAKQRKQLTATERLTNRILKEQERSGRKPKKRRMALRKRRLGKTRMPLYMLPQITKEPEPGFAYAHCTTKRGKLLRAGNGSAYVEMQLVNEVEDDEGNIKIKITYERYHISRETMIRALT